MNRLSQVKTNLSLSVLVTKQFVHIDLLDKISPSQWQREGERKKERKRNSKRKRIIEENVTYNRVDDAYTNAIVNIDLTKFISRALFLHSIVIDFIEIFLNQTEVNSFVSNISKNNEILFSFLEKTFLN